MPMASSSINQVEPTIDSFLACWTLLSARVVVVTGEAAASNEHLLQQLDFWREKVRSRCTPSECPRGPRGGVDGRYVGLG